MTTYETYLYTFYWADDTTTDIRAYDLDHAYIRIEELLPERFGETPIRIDRGPREIFASHLVTFQPEIGWKGE